MDEQQLNGSEASGGRAADQRAGAVGDPEAPDSGRPASRPPAGWQARTGAEQPWDAEDLAKAEGRDPTPENVRRAQRELDAQGAAAIEKTVP